MVMNGKSWPHTERLTYHVGEPVHIRVINVGAAVHPMHLHGFYFNVDSRGDERQRRDFPRREFAAPGQHRADDRRPDDYPSRGRRRRPGNWLFHCHDTAHIAAALPLDGSSAAGHIITSRIMRSR